MSRSSLFVRGALIVGSALLAACASQSGMNFVPAPGVPAANFGELAVPKPCAGQKTTAKSASLTQTLSTKGGSFCIPAFKGFGGTIFYPAANPTVKLAVTSSTTDYNHKMQPLGSGTVLFYLQIATKGGTQFAPSVKAGGGLTGKAIKSGQKYTAFGQAVVTGFPVPLTACYTIATKGKYGGVIGGVGIFLKVKVFQWPPAASSKSIPGNKRQESASVSEIAFSPLRIRSKASLLEAVPSNVILLPSSSE